MNWNLRIFNGSFVLCSMLFIDLEKLGAIQMSHERYLSTGTGTLSTSRDRKMCN